MDNAIKRKTILFNCKIVNLVKKIMMLNKTKTDA